MSWRGGKGFFVLSTWIAWASIIIERLSSSLVYLWDQLTVTTVKNTGETGDIHHSDPKCNCELKCVVESFPAVVSKSSSGTLGSSSGGSKWGSFSTIRPTSTAVGSLGSSSDLKRGSLVNPVSVGAPKPKKFFKSRETVAPVIDDDLNFTDSSVSQVRLHLQFGVRFPPFGLWEGSKYYSPVFRRGKIVQLWNCLDFKLHLITELVSGIWMVTWLVLHSDDCKTNHLNIGFQTVRQITWLFKYWALKMWDLGLFRVLL